MDVKAKIYLDFLLLCGKGVFYIEITLVTLNLDISMLAVSMPCNLPPETLKLLTFQLLSTLNFQPSTNSHPSTKRSDHVLHHLLHGQAVGLQQFGYVVSVFKLFALSEGSL